MPTTKPKFKICTEEFAHLNHSSTDIEILWVKILNPNHRNYIIGVTYRPPQGNTKIFVDYIEDCLEQIPNATHSDIFLLRDMNINYANTKCPKRKMLKNLETSTGLHQLINETTRYSAKLNSVIDLIFTNCPYILKSGVLNLNISDHECIFVSRKKKNL